MNQFKNFSLAFYFLFGTLLLFAGGCKKSGGNPGENTNPNISSDGTLSANIGGTSWQAGGVYAVDSSNIIFIIAGTNNAGTNTYPLILLAFPSNTPEGSTVSIDIAKNSMLQYYENQNTIYFAEPSIGGAGSIVVTKHNKGTRRIEGNFTASLKNAVVGGAVKPLTSGRFEINYR